MVVGYPRNQNARERDIHMGNPAVKDDQALTCALLINSRLGGLSVVLGDACLA